MDMVNDKIILYVVTSGDTISVLAEQPSLAAST